MLFGDRKKSVLLVGVSVCALILVPNAGTFAQQFPTVETSREANDRIQQLAAAKSVHTAGGITVGSGDLLHVDVFDVPELSRDVRVSDSGDIGFPLVPGKIPVSGLSTFQIEDQLAKLLMENGIVSHPQVTVFLKEQNSEPVSVVGAVNHPMVYHVIRSTNLLEVLAAAGGIADDAGSVIIITRATPEQTPAIHPASATAADTNPQSITIRLQDLLESGDVKYNVAVYGGDVISIPRAGIVYVMGRGVAQPGGYVVQEHGEQITVLKALALAHGLSGYAKANSAVIMRTNPQTGQKDQIPVHVKEIEHHKAEDVVMRSNDILYVPDSAGLKVLGRGAEAMVGIGTQVAVYRTP